MTDTPLPPATSPAVRRSSADTAVVCFATKHDKGPLVAGPLARAGLDVRVVEVDTDRFGTFSGEVERPGPPLDTAVAKARAGVEAALQTGAPTGPEAGGGALGGASEGSFAPHPDAPWVTLAQELVVLVDDRRGLVVAGRARSVDVLAVNRTVSPDDDLAALADAADLPQHAVVVRPHLDVPGTAAVVHKGVRDVDALRAAVGVAASTSADGLATVLTDLRAHLCPSRRPVIAAAAEDLARRWSTPCPTCASPGFGVERTLVGLPCAWCGGAVPAPRAERWACPACGENEERALVADDARGDPGHCPNCNP